MNEKAIFLSRTAALSAAIEHGRKAGVDDEIIAKRSAAFPVFRRGELQGYEAWFPISVGGPRQPVMEVHDDVGL